MIDEKEETKPGNKPTEQEQETLHLKNPFKEGEEVDITPEELEKEQEFKEALTERD
jgi:hypothetical protein